MFKLMSGKLSEKKSIWLTREMLSKPKKKKENEQFSLIFSKQI